jgi:TetR/AcrR family transcriptional regulator, transcriptional repressor for nem operon
MVRYKEDHHGKTHAAIIDAASTLLRERGFTETSVGTVMKAVGLTHGGFYAHFADKTAMLGAATEKAFVESPKNFAALASMAHAQADTGVIARHYLADHRVMDIASGCPAAALMSEMHRQDDAVRHAFQQGAEATMLALSEAPGLTDADHPRAWAALAMLFGGLSMMRAIPDAAVSEAIRAQIIDALRALAAAPASGADQAGRNVQS